MIEEYTKYLEKCRHRESWTTTIRRRDGTRRATRHAAGTTQLKNWLRRYPAAINLPVNLYDYVFDVPPGDDARARALSSVEHTRRRGPSMETATLARESWTL